MASTVANGGIENDTRVEPIEGELWDPPRKYYYGGHLGKHVTVSAFQSDDEGSRNMCKCEKCGDDSLYHDAWAWVKDDPVNTCCWEVLLCEDCYESTVPVGEKASYLKVLTQH